MEIIGANGQSQAAPGLNSATPGDLVKDGGDASFMTDVIEPSREVPVLVDFWAPWCGPCRQLGPTIERAVLAAEGAVKLVKINIDENPGVAGQLRIQSIPAVIAFKDGQPQDGFMGALPESQIKEFIARLTGTVDAGEIEALIERANQALAAGDPGGAAQDFATALQMDGENDQAIAGLARVHLAAGDAAQAKAILDSAPEAKKTAPAIAAVRASMELAGEVDGAPDLASSQTTVGQRPTDPAAHFDHARSLLASGDMGAAVDALLESISLDKDWSEGAARQLLLRVFEAAGPDAELVKAGRRRLSSMLFA